MRRWLRALVISLIASGAAALVFKMLRPRDTSSSGPDTDGGRSGSVPSHEDVVERLSDEQKEQMLSELEGHV